MASTIKKKDGADAPAPVSDERRVEAASDDHKAAIVQRILQGELSPEAACAREGLTTDLLAEWIRSYRRTTRRAVDADVAAALSAQGFEVEDFVLSGNLESMALAELLQTIRYGRKDGHIRIEHEGEHSHLWCIDGEVIDAQCGILVGTAAAYRLLSLRKGRLQASFSKVVRPRSIEASTEALLLESARRFDECAALRERLGDMSAVYFASPAAPLTEAQLDAPRLAVLRAFDGAHSVEDVVRQSVVGDLETLTAIQGFREAGWLVPRPTIWIAESGPPTPSTQAGTTVLPHVQSLRTRFSEPLVAQRWVWAALVTAAVSLPLAFAAGFWSARRQAPEGAAAAAPQSESTPQRGSKAQRGSTAATPAQAACPAGMTLFALDTAAASPGAAAPPPPYCLSQREVTVEQYSACVAAGRCEPAHADDGGAASAPGGAASDMETEAPGPDTPKAAVAESPSALAAADPDPAAQCNAGGAGGGQQPINCVTFRQAQDYCAWRGARLPTATEWELAARSIAAGKPAAIEDLHAGLAEWTRGEAPGDNPSEEPLHVVLGGGGRSAGETDEGRGGSRSYLGASAQARGVGFRCASSPR